MTRNQGYKEFSAICLSVIFVTGCVRVPPEKQPFQLPRSLQVNDIVGTVKFELLRAVVMQIFNHPQLWWLDPLYIRVHLKLNIDDKSRLNLSTPFMSQLDNVKGTTPEPSAKTDSSSTVATAPQYFTLGAGGEILGGANRTKDVEFDLSIPQIKRYITIQKKYQEQLSLLKKSKEAQLPDELDEIKLRTIRDVLRSYMQTIDSWSNQDVILVESDLGLSEWLEDALAQALRNRTSNAQAYRRLRPTHLALISHQIYFVVTPTGDMTSAWKLVRVSASNSPSLASITPKNKDTLIVSVGGQSQAAEAEIQTPHLRSVLRCRRRSKTEPISCVIELGLPHSAARDDDLDAAPAGKH